MRIDNTYAIERRPIIEIAEYMLFYRKSNVVITRIRFDQIENEVKEAVVELFDHLRDHSDNYITFLADGEYRPEYTGQFPPYVISDMLDYYKDASRLNFFQHYMNENYSFKKNPLQTSDTRSQIILEMMVYCHIWESTKYLKQLFRTLMLVKGKSYPWEVEEIPESSKHTFIRDTLRDGFKEANLKIAAVMTSGFRTSLRNSFLHGEFEIDPATHHITLHTYRNPRIIKAHELGERTANEWTEHFMYSAFLNYYFIVEKEKRRKSVEQDFGKDEFLIVYPRGKNSVYITKIYFDSSRHSFSFSRPMHSYVPPTQSTTTSLASPPVDPLPLTSKELDDIETEISTTVDEFFDKMEQASTAGYQAFLLDVVRDVNGTTVAPATAPEESRLEFSGLYLRDTYLHPRFAVAEIIRIHLEMLIYCHIWESKVFLKQLVTGIEIIEGADVSWTYEFQDDRRELVDDLANRYKIQNLGLGLQLEDAFHTSLRNAFAHSEFVIYSDEIKLDTFRPDRLWDIESITIKDWTIKVVKSIMIDHYFHIHKERRKLALPPGTLQHVLSNL